MEWGKVTKKYYINHWILIFLLISTAVFGNGRAVKINLPRVVTVRDAEPDAKEITLRLGSNSNVDKTDVDVEECVASAFDVPGQAWHVDLSTGGFTFKPPQPNYFRVTAADRVAELGLANVDSSDPNNIDVNILVIDNFDLTSIKTVESGTGFRPENTWSFRHGALVVAHLESILEASQFNIESVSPLGKYRINDRFKRDSDMRTIRILGFDYGNLGASTNKPPKLISTSMLTDALNKAVGNTLNGSKLVINMSFALVPCNILGRYAEFEDIAYKMNVKYPFDQFLSALEKANEAQWGNEITIKTILNQIDSHDPFLNWIQSQQKNKDTVVIASGGNYDLKYQVMPASWSGVLGVGSTSAETNAASEWSDVSDISEIGEWFSLPPGGHGWLCLSGQRARCISSAAFPTANFAYRGTSFAAPTVSAAFAINIGKSMCSPTGSGSWPIIMKNMMLPFVTHRSGCR